MVTSKGRVSTQPLVPARLTGQTIVDGYNPFPFHPIGDGRIFNGYKKLAKLIINHRNVLIEGYSGIYFDAIREAITQELDGYTVRWIITADYLKPQAELDELLKPYLGDPEAVWGRKSDLELKDYFDTAAFFTLKPDESYDVNIVLGTGAGLLDWKVPVLYFDLPKNEIQYRMRAQTIYNLGKTSPESPFSMYKQFYFVDWPVLDAHRARILPDISVFVDGQPDDDINWMFRIDLLAGLRQCTWKVLRARPWFEKGSWGGQWMKAHIPAINQEEVNYAWSFELITPENGILLESNGLLLEVPFDLLMLVEHEAILGKHAAAFGTYFPIRFDFLDTFDGGNLSIQCHPSKPYIREHFGEQITQDETYYILDCKPGAKVYLGFQEDIEPEAFRTTLEKSQLEQEQIDIEKYVQSFPSHKHDLFLIPNGTVHSAGVNNMVLEISATPYIFTFKMYDWLSLDLNGKPRPINIGHAFNNLRFERKGTRVQEELIAHPVCIAEGRDWQLIHLPTHADHFYDVHRIELHTEVTVFTDHCCHVLMLVEGHKITVEISGEEPATFHYAETFIIPASVESYKLIYTGEGKAKVIKAFIKETYEARS